MPTRKPAGAGTWVDPDDAPPLTDAFFERAEIREGDRIVRPGRTPDAPAPGLVQLEPDLLERLRATGPGWQARVNEAVREWLQRHAA